MELPAVLPSSSNLAPTKIWVVEGISSYIKEYKESISETKNSVALIQLVRIGLNENGDGRYGNILKKNNVTIHMMKSHGVRINKDIDTKVRSYGGKNDLNVCQSYFDLICFGLSAFYFYQKNVKSNSYADVGSILFKIPSSKTK